MNGRQTARKHSSGTMAYQTPKTVVVSEIGVPIRQRTGRACDQCRRRKTKCDGTLHCKSCIEIGLDCSYGHRIKQARGPQYVAHLESRLRMLENDDEHRKTLAGLRNPDGNDSSNSSKPLSSQQSLEICNPRPSSSRSSSSSKFEQQNVPKNLPTYLESKLDEQQLKRKFADDADQTPHHRQRSASEILTDAKTILEQLSPTNYTARCAAECIQSLDENLYPYAPPPQPLYDFTLFESNNSYPPEPNAKLGSFDSKQLLADANIDQAQGFAIPNSPSWLNAEYLDCFSSGCAL